MSRRPRTGFARRPGFRGIGGGSVAPPPTVSISGTVAHGETLTASATDATGYQWKANGIAISGETASTLTVDRADGGYYTGITCTVTGPGGSATSNTLLYDYLVGLGTTVMIADMAEDVTTVSGAIDSMLDQSPRANNLTAPGAGNRPTYTASDSQFNNQPSGTGDGVDDSLIKAVMSMGGTFQGTQIVVGRLVVNTGGRPWMSMGVNECNTRDSTLNRMEAFFKVTTPGATTTTFNGAAHVMMTVSDGTDVRYYIDGAAQGTPAAIGGTVADGLAFRIFARSDGLSPANAKMAFAGMSRTPITAAAAADFGQYSRERFGTP